MGDPLEGTTSMGALVSEDHMKKVLSYIELAREHGTQALCCVAATRMSGRTSRSADTSFACQADGAVMLTLSGRHVLTSM